MKLLQAIKESDERAAILSLPTHPWNYVVVEHVYQEYGYIKNYTTEIHQYNDNELRNLIVGFDHITYDQLKVRLGLFFESVEWEPYGEPYSQKYSFREARRRINDHVKKVRNVKQPHRKRRFNSINSDETLYQGASRKAWYDEYLPME